MVSLRSLLWFWLTLPVIAAAAPSLAPDWNRVQIEPMKTSIYVGRVTLLTEPFVRSGNTFTATYQAKVFPWAFWNETGEIRIVIDEANLAKLRRGERCEFTGEALNHKQKPRHVTGYADPSGAHRGRIKVRICVDDTELIFNGPYTLAHYTVQAVEPPQASAAQ